MGTVKIIKTELSDITGPSVLVVGGSFAGLTAAFEIKRKLKDKVNVRVIARQEEFVFIPSLIWLVPGWRRKEQIKNRVIFNLDGTFFCQ
jgi:sulfide:quinone oxidoreductase